MKAYVSNCFDALGDRTRRGIFERLARRAASVGELAEEFPVSRPAVSQHLKVLKDAGLVTSRSHGTKNVYAVDPQGVKVMKAYLEQFWQENLDAFASYLENEK